MDQFLKMDIFFVVATVCLLVITILLSVALWKLISILYKVEHLAELAGKEAEHLREDAQYLRGRVVGAIEGIFSFLPGKKKPVSSRSHHSKDELI